MADVYAAARTLAREVADSREAREMKRIGARVKANERINGLLAEYRRAQYDVQAVQAQGGTPTEEQRQRLSALAQQVESETALREYLRAEAAYGQMLMEVQQILGEIFDPDVPGAVRMRR